MVKLKVCVAVAEVASVTRTVKVQDAAVAGVPVIAPEADNVSPIGRVRLDTRAQV
jgi:hypothetical protein